MKALVAGKHVLLEKPSADTVEETRAMFKLAEEKGLVLLEAFHYRYLWILMIFSCSDFRTISFHPAIQRVKALLDSGKLGAIKSLTANLTLPGSLFKDSDIRFNFELGGGAMMDVGCVCRF
jgi:predicted dehydrogenase